MTLHDPAISRPVPLLDRVRSALAARLRRRASGGEPPPFVMVHLHDRPRATALTSVGVVPVLLTGACLYEDAIVFRMLLAAEQDMTVDAVVVRFGASEMGMGGEVPLPMSAGDQVRFSWAVQLGSMGVILETPDGEETLVTPTDGDDPPAEPAS